MAWRLDLDIGVVGGVGIFRGLLIQPTEDTVSRDADGKYGLQEPAANVRSKAGDEAKILGGLAWSRSHSSGEWHKGSMRSRGPAAGCRNCAAARRSRANRRRRG